MGAGLLNPLDRCFLLLESRRTMMHVAGLLPFAFPDDASQDELRTVAEELQASGNIQSPWNLRLRHSHFLSHPLQAWIEDPNIDLDYHLRRSALPRPGGERELGKLVSRLHSQQIDFHRPPWELHIIEGLSDNRFALYFKMHHALVDGFTGTRMLARSLSDTAGETQTPLFLTQPQPRSGGSRDSADDVATIARTAIEQARGQLGTSRDIGRAVQAMRHAVSDYDPALAVPMRAPHSILNGRVGRNRRFATQQFDLARVKSLAAAVGGTINDIVLALCASSLRRFLSDLDALPDAPLVTMIPVNVRPRDDPGGGNAVGMMLASLATDISSPKGRLAAIMESTARAKSLLQGMSRSAIMQYSALLMAPFAAQVFTGTSGRLRPPFNVVVSNVPGPEKPLYFRGARLEATYPVSIPVHGQALNITCNSYADTLNFGFVGCRDSLPHMQHLAVYTAEALEELEAVLSGR